MATAEDDGWRGGGRERGHDRRGDDRWRGGDRGRGRGGDDRGRGRGGDDRGRGRGGWRANDRARSPTGHAAAGNAASGVPQVATSSWLPSEGPRATSMAQTESPEPRHTMYGDAHCDDDADLQKMKKYIEELELKNAELKQKLDAAQAQLKEWKNCDPLIDKEVRKCHDVFLCPHESDYKKVTEFLHDSRSKLTMDVNVHGRRVVKALKQLEKDLPLFVPRGVSAGTMEPKILRRMTPVAKCLILGIIEDIYRLHRHGLSLNGKFTLDHFYWTHLKKVKLDPVLKLAVCNRDRTKMISDYHQVYQIIMEMLSLHNSGLSIPDDLQSLLNLLNTTDPVKHHEIIRYNMSLMTEIGKKSHFITLYDRLQQQIDEDETKGPEEDKKSEKVLKFISSQFTCPDNKEPWSSMAMDNVYVGAIYGTRRRFKGEMKDPLELLIVWRNALCHILEKSSNIKDGVLLFKDEDLVNMLESAIPNVFNGLQRAMSEVGLLELPHLMRVMKM